MYFAALIPEEPELTEIHRIKRDFAEKYGAVHALRSPPHITIIPPFRHSGFPGDLIEELKEQLKDVRTFSIVVDEYDAFPPRVIFLKIPDSDNLNSVYKLSKAAFTGSGKTWTWNRPFHPHLTIAFRDLSPKVFHAALKEGLQVKKQMELRFKGLSFLKLFPEGWKVMEEGFVEFKRSVN